MKKHLFNMLEGMLVCLISWFVCFGAALLVQDSKPPLLLGVTTVNIKTNADKSEVWISDGGVFAESIVSINGSLRTKSVIGTRYGVHTLYSVPNEHARYAWRLVHG